MKVKLILMVILLSFTSVVFADHDNYHTDILSAIKDSKVNLNARYRFEYADLDGFSRTAKASTIRTLVGVKTGSYYGFKGMLEIEDITAVGNDNYNSTTNGNTSYPVIADPEITEINQAWLSYDLAHNSHAKYGRYRLILDNARFVGDVGWRQNSQTFDGATLNINEIKDVKFFYGYSSNVNRIFGNDNPAGNFDSELHMFNLSYSGIANTKLVVYSYLLDFKNANAISTKSFGILYDGKFQLGEDLKLLVDAEYAYQSDYADNPVSYDVNYYRAQLGLNTHGFTIQGAYELLGSDNGNASFSTPLSTLHKWNGFADVFLVTPVNGLEDIYGTLTYEFKSDCNLLNGLRIKAWYHEFRSDEGSTNYGSEWDFDVIKKFGKHYYVGIRYANYDANNFGVDTERLIINLGGNFNI